MIQFLSSAFTLSLWVFRRIWFRLLPFFQSFILYFPANLHFPPSFLSAHFEWQILNWFSSSAPSSVAPLDFWTFRFLIDHNTFTFSFLRFFLLDFWPVLSTSHSTYRAISSTYQKCPARASAPCFGWLSTLIGSLSSQCSALLSSRNPWAMLSSCSNLFSIVPISSPICWLELGNRCWFSVGSLAQVLL